MQITGAFLAERAEIVDPKLNVTGGVSAVATTSCLIWLHRKLLEGTTRQADFRGYKKGPPAPQEQDAGGKRTALLSCRLAPRR